MSKIRKPILVVATLIFIIGGVTTGMALLQIYQMNDFQKTINTEISKLKTVKVVRPGVSHISQASLRQGEVIGIITIPKLQEIYPIVQGTDENDLKRGVGHYVGSVMPGEMDNSVLSGHRDSVFSKLGNLVKGDFIIIKTSDGTFKYSVTRSRIVLANDRTVIVPTPTAMLTLSTCYPFSYIGSAPKRYIVSAQLMR